ncbi:MAG: hypothetical protein C9356_11975 [Oleiphilus sp.]|nr:MAG: hypothetical protein C9356_11975 [Oleiphilus sp.]
MTNTVALIPDVLDEIQKKQIGVIVSDLLAANQALDDLVTRLCDQLQVQNIDSPSASLKRAEDRISLSAKDLMAFIADHAPDFGIKAEDANKAVPTKRINWLLDVHGLRGLVETKCCMTTCDGLRTMVSRECPIQVAGQ